MKALTQPKLPSKRIMLLSGKIIRVCYYTLYHPGNGVVLYWTSQKGENKTAFRAWGEEEFKEI